MLQASFELRSHAPMLCDWTLEVVESRARGLVSGGVRNAPRSFPTRAHVCSLVVTRVGVAEERHEVAAAVGEDVAIAEISARGAEEGGLGPFRASHPSPQCRIPNDAVEGGEEVGGVGRVAVLGEEVGARRGTPQDQRPGRLRARGQELSCDALRSGVCQDGAEGNAGAL